MPTRPTMNLTPSGNPVYLTLMSEFMRCPTHFFTPEPCPSGTVYQHDRKKINVCDRSDKRRKIFPDSMGGVLKISSEQELNSLTYRLLKKPLFFTVDIEHSTKSTCGNVNYITKGEFAVTVNTQHPAIQNAFKTKLAEGLIALKQGKYFAIELDFNQIIKAWMHGVFVDRDSMDDLGCYTTYSCEHGKVTITNYSELEECYSLNLSYQTLAMWIICLPCCLVSCPCYRLHRALKVEDFYSDFEGIVATLWSPMQELRNVQEAVALALAVMTNARATEATSVDMPPNYDAVVRQPPGPSEGLAYGQVGSRDSCRPAGLGPDEQQATRAPGPSGAPYYPQVGGQYPGQTSGHFQGQTQDPYSQQANLL